MTIYSLDVLLSRFETSLNKASGGNEIPVDLFQILKDDTLWKWYTQYISKSGKLSSGHRTGKCQFSFQSQRKAMLKNAQTTTQFHSSHTLVRRRRWHPTPVFLPGKSHGWRSLVGCSPWGCEEFDTTEQLHFHFSLSCTGEGNGNSLQYSCLKNPRDGGAWWATVYGVV